MSFKNNYIELAKKFGGPYSLVKKGIKRGQIDSIMQGSMPSLENAYKVAQALGVTLETLLTGEEKPPAHAAEEEAPYGVTPMWSPEEKEYIEKLVEVLRNPNTKKAIQENINTFLKVPKPPPKKREQDHS